MTFGELDDRTGPAVRHEQRQGVVVRRAQVRELDVQPVDLGDELPQLVEPRLELARVVAGAQYSTSGRIFANWTPGSGRAPSPCPANASPARAAGGRRSPSAGHRSGTGGSPGPGPLWWSTRSRSNQPWTSPDSWDAHVRVAPLLSAGARGSPWSRSGSRRRRVEPIGPPLRGPDRRAGRYQ
jgi:hypothetical protein